jgi:hypothetical protein
MFPWDTLVGIIAFDVFKAKRYPRKSFEHARLDTVPRVEVRPLVSLSKARNDVEDVLAGEKSGWFIPSLRRTDGLGCFCAMRMPLSPVI